MKTSQLLLLGAVVAAVFAAAFMVSVYGSPRKEGFASGGDVVGLFPGETPSAIFTLGPKLPGTGAPGAIPLIPTPSHANPRPATALPAAKPSPAAYSASRQSSPRTVPKPSKSGPSPAPTWGPAQSAALTKVQSACVGKPMSTQIGTTGRRCSDFRLE
jgi:hypothetical protein